jgi:hypothetical protein
MAGLGDVFGGSWEGLWRVLEGLEGFRDGLWRGLGGSWEGHGGSWRILESLGGSWEDLGRVLESLGKVLGGSRRVLGGSWAYFWRRVWIKGFQKGSRWHQHCFQEEANTKNWNIAKTLKKQWFFIDF